MARRRKARKAKPWANRVGSYAVSQADGVVRLVPRPLSSPALMGGYLAGILAVIACAVLGGWAWFAGFLGESPAPSPGPPWWIVWLLPGGLFLLLAVALLAGAARLFWMGSTPLVIDSTGRMRYGRREVIPPGLAKTVRLHKNFRCADESEEPTAEDAKTCHLSVEGADGRLYPLPVPYFSAFDGWDVGHELATALAAALKVPVLTETPPAGPS